MTAPYRHAIGIAAVVAGLLGATAAVADDLEPNDESGLASALPVNATQSGALTPAGDEDWYTITVPGPGRLAMSLTALPPDIRPSMSLYGRHRQWLNRYVTAINDGDNVFLTDDLDEPGTYYLRLSAANNGSSSDSYTLRADFTAVTDPAEANDDIGDATLITQVGVAGTIFPAYDTDWYRLYLSAGNRLELTLTSPASMRGALTIYDANFDWINAYDSAVNAGDTLSLGYDVTTSGFYHIRVEDADGGASLAAYGLTASGGQPGYEPSVSIHSAEVESNDEWRLATVVAVDTTIGGALATANDLDWYSFTLPQPGELSVDLQAVPAGMTGRVNLYDRSGRHLAGNQATSAGAMTAILIDLAETGVYYLRIDDATGASSAGYEIDLSLIPAPDAFEPNADSGDATLLAVSNQVSAYLLPAGDDDWYRFTAAAGAELRIIVSGLDDGLVPYLTLYDRSLRGLQSAAGVSPGTDLSLRYTTSESGQYFLRVSAGGRAAQPYVLTIHGADFQIFAPTASIDLIDPGAIVVGDSVTFTGSGFDSDGTIAALSWRSSIDGLLSDQASFSTSALSAGTHTIYLAVQDNDGLWSTEDSAVLYVGTTVSDESESNDSLGHANEIALARQVRGHIDPAGDRDHFRIYVDRPGELTLLASNVPGTLRLNLTLYNADYGWLGVYRTAALAGDDVELVYDVAEPGFYYLAIRDDANAAEPAFTYTLRADLIPAVDAFEPNDELLTARILPTASIDALMFPAYDNDWYQVWVTGGVAVAAALHDVPDSLALSLTLYDRNRDWVNAHAAAVSPGDDVSVTHTFDDDGFIYIRVTADAARDPARSYSLTMTNAQPGFVPPFLPATAEVEPNEIAAEATDIPLGAAVTGAAADDSDRDWYRLMITSPGVLTVELTEVAPLLRPRVAVHAADGSFLGETTASNAGDLVDLELALTRPDVYYLQVYDRNRDGQSLAYSLRAGLVTALDVHEPNDRFSEAAPFAEHNTLQGILFPDQDNDWFQVTVDTPGEVRFVLADVPATQRAAMHLYDRDYRALTSGYATNPGQEVILAYAVTEPGPYYIRLTQQNSGTVTEPYTLLASGAVFTSYAPVATIDSVTPSPALIDELVTMRGHGEDPDGQVALLAWRSSLDGELGQSAVLTRTLSAGQHQLYLKVRDNDGHWSPETSTRLYVGAEAPQETEPNGEIGSATPLTLGLLYAAQIAPAGDVDLYAVSVSEPGRLTVATSNPVGSGMRAQLTIYNREGDWLRSLADASNPGDPLLATIDLGDPGIYFLRVYDLEGGSDRDYTIMASLEVANDTFEPNDEVSEATPLPTPGTVQAFIFPGYDIDWYRIDLTTPGDLQVSMTNVSPLVAGTLTLYDSNIGWLNVTVSANNDGDDISIAYAAPRAGPYYLRVVGQGDDVDPAQTYTLSTTFVPVLDLHEPNNRPDLATALTGSTTGYIYAYWDEDWYLFYADADAALTVTIDQAPTALRPSLIVYNRDVGSFASATTDDDGGIVQWTGVAPTAGYYYLRVTDRDGEISADPYRLTVAGARFDYQPPTTTVSLEVEPNDTRGTPNRVVLGGITGDLAGDWDEDWFVFTTASAGLLTVNLAAPPTVRSVIQISNATDVLATRTAQNPGDASVLEVELPDAGDWRVRIYDAENSHSAQAYQLTLEFAPAPDSYEPNPEFRDAATVATGTTLSAYIFPSSETDWYRFAIDQPGTIVVESVTAPAELRLDAILYDHAYAQLTDATVENGGDPLRLSWRADHAGAYYLRVFDRESQSATEPYQLLISLTPAADAWEPNQRFSQATAMAGENRVRGSIFPADDEDWYRFTVATPGTVTVQLAETYGLPPHLELRNDSNNHLDEVWSETPGATLMLRRELIADTYYLRVRSATSDGVSTSSYLLSIDGGAFDQTYPLAEVAGIWPNPLLVGAPATLTGALVGRPGAAPEVTFRWRSDRDGDLGQGQILTTSNLSAGRHQIQLRITDPTGRSSAWVSRQLQVVSDLLTEAEYNDDLAAAHDVPLGTWITAAITPRGDRDAFRFYLPTRGTLTVTALPTSGDMRPTAVLYNGDQNYLAGYGAPYPDQRLTRIVDLAAGWYYFRIADGNDSTAAPTYTVRFDFIGPDDRGEIDDAPRLAGQLLAGENVSGNSFALRYDDDWYRVDVPTRGRLFLELLPSAAAMLGRLTLYGPNIEWLNAVNEATNPGDTVYLEYDINTPGQYYLRLTDAGNTALTTTYELHTQLVPVVDSYEPNDDFGSASLLTQESIAGFIFPAGDDDWYRLWVPAGRALLTASVTGAPAAMRPYVAIYGRHLQWLGAAVSGNNAGDNVRVEFDVQEPGYYYVVVADADGRAHLGSYQLTVTGGTVDYEPVLTEHTSETETNDDYGDADYFQPAQTVTGQIDPQGDEDWWRFYVNSEGVLEIAHTNIPAGITSELWLYNRNGDVLDYRTTTNPGEDNVMITTVAAGGHYYLRLRDRNNDNQSSSVYSLTVTHTPVVDPYEPNNDFGTAAAMAQDTVSGYLFPENDADYYALYIRQPTMLTVSLDVVPAANRPYLQLRDGDNSTLATWQATNAGDGGNDLISYQVTEPGFYQVRLTDADSAYGTELYTLRISGADFSLAPELIAIGDRTLSEGVPYGFRVTARDPDNPEALVFSAANLPPGAAFDAATATFSWTPGFDQANTYVGVHFQVSDGLATDVEDITMVVLDNSRAPVLDAIGNRSVSVLTQLAFTLAATDTDGEELVYSASNLPDGAEFDPDTRIFSWIPALAAVGLHTDLLFEVTDGVRTDFELVDVEVLPVPPTAVTESVVYVTEGGGMVSIDLQSDGGSPLLAAGCVIGAQPLPTLDDLVVPLASPVMGPAQVAVHGLDAGATYYVRAFAGNAAGTSYGSDLTLTTMVPKPLPYSEDFNGATAPPDWQHGSQGDDLFEWGMPTSGPGSDHDGDGALFATILDDDYPNNADGYLLTPVFDLGLGYEGPVASFQMWARSELDYDGLLIEVRTSTAPAFVPLASQLVTPSYNSDIDGFGPCWSGTDLNLWTLVQIDLADYVGDLVQLRLVFHSDGGATDDGFYLDDFAVDATVLPPAVSFVAAMSAAPEAQPAVPVEISLSRSVDYEVSVDLTVTGGTATANDDFEVALGSVVFNPGVQQLSIAIVHLDDDVIEPDETVTLELRNPRGASLGTTVVHVHTIGDDDTPVPPTVQSVTPGSGTQPAPAVAVNEGDEQAFGITIDPAAIGVTYQWQVGDQNIAGATAAVFTYQPGFDTVIHPDTAVVVTVRCLVAADGGEAEVTWLQVTVDDVNRQPTAGDLTVAVTPAEPLTTDVLVAEVAGRGDDPDAEDVLGLQYLYTWDEALGSSISHGPQATGSDTLPAAATLRGDEWTCTVRVVDALGAIGPPLISAGVVIGNSPPELQSVEITSDTPLPFTTSTLTALTRGWHDADGDAEGYLFQWRRNGADLPNTNKPTLDNHSGIIFEVGDVLTVVATPVDDADNGTPVASAPLIVVSQDAWSLTISATNADKPDVTLGMADGATADFDPGIDLDAAPNPPEDIGGIYFLQQDFEYRRDLRAPAAEDEWRLIVLPGANDMALSWPEPPPIPGRLLLDELTLGGDPIAGTTVVIDAAGGFTVTGEAVRIYRLRLQLEEAIDIMLYAGWNQISLPIEPHDPDVAVVLADAGIDELPARSFRDGLRGTFNSGNVWTWQGGIYSVVTELHALRGYWVYVASNVEITVRGTAVTNAMVTLEADWNMLGPAAVMARPTDAALRGNVWRWDGQYYQAVETLYPGFGYWLNATAVIELNLRP